MWCVNCQICIVSEICRYICGHIFVLQCSDHLLGFIFGVLNIGNRKGFLYSVNIDSITVLFFIKILLQVCIYFIFGFTVSCHFLCIQYICLFNLVKMYIMSASMVLSIILRQMNITFWIHAFQFNWWEYTCKCRIKFVKLFCFVFT